MHTRQSDMYCLKEIKEINELEEVFEVEELLWQRRPRIFRKRVNLLEKYDDLDFLKRFRLSKATVVYLLEKIEGFLEFPDNRNNSLSPINQLLVALRFYATGCHLLSAGDMAGISVSTVSRIVKRVTDAIVTLRSEFIIFPDTPEELDKVKAQFYQIAKFPCTIGAIDCTHVKIQSPGGDDAELFRNRKGYMSINVQTIASADLLIRNLVCHWPGSAHDSAIYQISKIYSKFERGVYPQCHILGDSGYPLKSHLLTPYLNPRTRGQQLYNTAQIKTRNVVERQYGVLKRRFPVLAIGIRLKLKTSCNVIMACCILHNICILRKEKKPPCENLIENLEELILNGQIDTPAQNTSNQYGFRRNQMTQYFENMNS